MNRMHVSGLVRAGSVSATAVIAMPECENCGNHLSADYVRVMIPEGYGDIDKCPDCSPRSVRFGGNQRLK